MERGVADTLTCRSIAGIRSVSANDAGTFWPRSGLTPCTRGHHPETPHPPSEPTRTAARGRYSDYPPSAKQPWQRGVSPTEGMVARFELGRTVPYVPWGAALMCPERLVVCPGRAILGRSQPRLGSIRMPWGTGLNARLGR